MDGGSGGRGVISEFVLCVYISGLVELADEATYLSHHVEGER